jgi:hypothetical protein
MDHKNLIYGLVDPRTDEIRYIGKSTSGLKRPREHMSASSLRLRSHKNNWINILLGLELQPEIRILEEAPNDCPCLGDYERFWIAQGRGLGWPLTNMTKGGDGGGGPKTPEGLARMAAAHKGKSPTPETRAKQRAAKLGRKLSQNTRQKMSAARTGHPVTEETRDKLSRTHAALAASGATYVFQKGHIMSDETRRRVSASNLGKPKSDQHRARLRDSHLGYVMPQEQKDKIAEAVKLAWSKKKAK